MALSTNLAVIVLAAGMGTRMRSTLPKVMHPLAGRPMVSHLMETVSALSPDRAVVVVGPDMEQVAKAVAPANCVVQADRLGTAHAVAQARAELDGFEGDVLVLYGDTPLISQATMSKLLAERRSAQNPAVVVLGFKPKDPGAYGRLVVGADGLRAIVEYKDATSEQRAIPLCNSGVMAIDGKVLWKLIDLVDNQNANSEFYLTDLVALARNSGRNCSYVLGDEAELLGINSRAELSVAEGVVQNQIRARVLESGVTLIDAASVWFCHDTKIAPDVTIWPHVIFGPNVTVQTGVTIKGFCHFEGCVIKAGADVGPFARLRPGTEIGENAHIGNFVEVKKAEVGAGAKINHLSYIGDARVGDGANVGAGTITCNYDGFDKAFTDIGESAFIGSNSCLVAPVKIGARSIVGAGSVITKTVTEGALAVSRGSQMELSGWADRFRARKSAEKAAKKEKQTKAKLLKDA